MRVRPTYCDRRARPPLSRRGVGGARCVNSGQRMIGAAFHRLFQLSARALTDAELLSLLVEADANALAEDLRGLSQRDPDDWLDDPRVSPAEAARLLAAFELGRRAVIEVRPRMRLRSPDAIWQLMRPQLANLSREELHVLCLDNSGHLLRRSRAAVGSTSQCMVDPREVFAPAVAARASSVVLVHNHPSGIPEPSALDLALTRQLVTAGETLGIRVVDHLILGDGAYTSLRERGMFPHGDASAASAMG